MLKTYFILKSPPVSSQHNCNWLTITHQQKKKILLQTITRNFENDNEGNPLQSARSITVQKLTALESRSPPHHWNWAVRLSEEKALQR